MRPFDLNSPAIILVFQGSLLAHNDRSSRILPHPLLCESNVGRSFGIEYHGRHQFALVRLCGQMALKGRIDELTAAMIFKGPRFYQRLIHKAEDKAKF